MPVDICGYIEVSKSCDDDPNWMSLMDIGCMLLLTGDVCQILFGESKSGSDECWQPVAHRRGLPNDVVTAQAIAARQLAIDNPEFAIWGFTHINYEEIKQIQWNSYEGADLTELEIDWNKLFAIMDAIDGYFDRQRLIVWFEWW